MPLLHEHTVRVLQHPTPETVTAFLNDMGGDGWSYLGTLDIPQERGQLSLVFQRINPEYWSRDE